MHEFNEEAVRSMLLEFSLLHARLNPRHTTLMINGLHLRQA